MKRILIAIAFAAFGASSPFAQSVEVPPPKCEPKPDYPGRLALSVDSTRKSFERHQKNYDTCMKAYLAERNAAIDANKKAANAAIDEYNAIAAQIKKQIEADRE